MRPKNRMWISGTIVGFALTACLFASTSVAQTAASPYTTGYRYNADGQQTGEIQACTATGCLATRNAYNSAGLLSEVDEGSLAGWPGNTVPSQWSGFTIYTIVIYTYDSMGHVTSKQVSSSGGAAYELTQYSYDSMERELCEAVRMDSLVSTTNVCAQSGPDDRVTYTTYDAQNHPLKIYRAYGSPLAEAYVTYTYNLNGLMQTETDANSNVTTVNYDGLDRISNTEFPSKTSPGASDTADVEQYTYDNNDNRSTLVTRDKQTINTPMTT